jgi:hypothetical protein
MLYRLLTGQLPFRGSNRMVLNQVMNDEPQSPKVFDDQIPFDLATIALKAMEKGQKNRFVSAGKMAENGINVAVGSQVYLVSKNDLQVIRHLKFHPNHARRSVCPYAIDGAPNGASSNW